MIWVDLISSTKPAPYLWSEMLAFIYPDLLARQETYLNIMSSEALALGLEDAQEEIELAYGTCPAGIWN